jgi:acetylornithine/succinyldiaminopimelate/putrescine aminotransferase
METEMQTTRQLYDSYEQRFWRTLAQRTRSREMEFVLGRREGAYVWEKDSGFRLLDCGGSGGVHSLGHRNPEILDALRGAIDCGLDAGLWSFPTHEMLAFNDALTDSAPAPSLNRSVVTLGATASIDLAVQFAAKVTGRTRIAAYLHGYHGHAGFAALVTGSEEEGIARYYGMPNPTGVFFSTYGDLAAVAGVLDETVAAVIVEPLNYETFAPAPEGFLTGLEALCRANGSLLIIDETRTGLSRSGKVWMSQHSGVQPDMLISGKGLGGGVYPVSALLTTEAIYETCMNGHPYAFASSMAGNEIATTVGRTVIEICGRPETLQGVAGLESRFAANFGDLCARHPGVFQPGTVLGGIATLGLVRKEDCATVGVELFRRGIYCHSVSVASPDVVKFFPVLTAPAEIADEVASALDDFAATRN